MPVKVLVDVGSLPELGLGAVDVQHLVAAAHAETSLLKSPFAVVVHEGEVAALEREADFGALAGLELDFVEGSRKSKVASFTKAGRVFSRERIIPAIEAEERAFSTLASREREQLVVLVKRYVDALDAEIGRAHECVERVEGKQEDAVRASCDLWGESEPCPGEH